MQDELGILQRSLTAGRVMKGTLIGFLQRHLQGRTDILLMTSKASATTLPPSQKTSKVKYTARIPIFVALAGALTRPFTELLVNLTKALPQTSDPTSAPLKNNKFTPLHRRIPPARPRRNRYILRRCHAPRCYAIPTKNLGRTRTRVPGYAHGCMD